MVVAIAAWMAYAFEQGEISWKCMNDFLWYEMDVG